MLGMAIVRAITWEKRTAAMAGHFAAERPESRDRNGAATYASGKIEFASRSAPKVPIRSCIRGYMKSCTRIPHIPNVAR